MTANTLPQLLFEQGAKYGDRVALRYKKFGIWHEISWREYGEQVRCVALGLIALDLEPGQCVSIISENRPEWLFADLGVQAAGGISVGVYTTNSVEECQYIVEHSESRFYICEDEEQLDKALAFRAQTPKLKKIIVIDTKGLRHFEDPMVMSLAELLDYGKKLEMRKAGLFDQRLAEGQPDDVAVIVYTSGTTGPPKGAMLNHRTILWTARLLGQVEPTSDREEVISYLPLAHAAQRILSVFDQLYYGYVVNFVENLDTFPQNLREVRPTQFFAPPRVWEKFYSQIMIATAEATWFKRLSFSLAYTMGRQVARLRLEKKGVPPHLALLYRLSDLLVFRKIRKLLGLDRARFVFSGAAPISPDLIFFFHGLGLRLCEIYGQTENCGPATIHQHGEVIPGTVGRPFPGVEVKIAGDGEILLRGGNVFQGYFKNPEATAKTLEGGWLHTGDVGEITPEGHLRITDRKKDLIITAMGKNIAPQNIENQLKFTPYIADAVVIGDKKPYLVALIIIDEDNVVKWAQDHRVPFSTYADLSQNGEVHKLIGREVEKVNATLARVETIKKFRILNKKLDPEDGDVTPTMKVKRKAIHERYVELIDSMYGGRS